MQQSNFTTYSKHICPNQADMPCSLFSCSLNTFAASLKITEDQNNLYAGYTNKATFGEVCHNCSLLKGILVGYNLKSLIILSQMYI